MFNLIVGFEGSITDTTRVLEYTDPVIADYVRPGGRGTEIDISRLLNLPTLHMAEVQGGSEQVAHIGYLDSLTYPSRSKYVYRFAPTPGIRPVPAEAVVAAASELGIDEWEFRRTHWAVKDADVYRILSSSLLPPPPPDLQPNVFKFPDEPQDDDLVAVMMPFDASFYSVWEALQEVVADVGLRIERADTIWKNAAIIDDIADLIWRAGIVISDLSQKNANVFYETGIAHTLGRNVITIAQSMDDIPFDLRHLRSVPYYRNREGLAQLKSQLEPRLRSLSARPA